jgi:uncharacterized protein (TIGR02996 family)
MPTRASRSPWPGPEAKGFLADIIAHPDDDAPRLIFADWLEEHEMTERAQFIRSQIEHSRKLAADPDFRNQPLPFLPMYSLKPYQKPWLNEIPPWARQSCGFTRGFIEFVRTTAIQWLSGAAALRKATPLRHLSLFYVNRAGVRARDALETPHFAGLRDLTLDPIPADLAHLLAGNPSLADLKKLNLWGSRIPSEGVYSLSRSHYLSGLTTLELSENSIDDEGAFHLAGSSSLRRLVILGLGANSITAVGIRDLASSPILAHVERLSFSNHIGPTDLAPTRFRDAGAQALAESPHLGRLTALDLDSQGIGHPGAEILAAASRFPGLRELNLSRNPIGPNGARALASSPHLAGLKRLVLAGCGIGDEGARALAPSLHLGGLTSLNVRDNGITNAGIQALLDSPHLSALRRLDADLTIQHELAAAFKERFGS